jgi:hypothetical protein
MCMLLVVLVIPMTGSIALIVNCVALQHVSLLPLSPSLSTAATGSTTSLCTTDRSLTRLLLL